MASIIFTAPRHLDPSEVMSWAPGVLFVPNRLHNLYAGDFVYVCNRNRVLFRAKYEKPVWLERKDTVDGEHIGPGWALKVGEPEFPPHDIIRQCSRLKYVYEELW